MDDGAAAPSAVAALRAAVAAEEALLALEAQELRAIVDKHGALAARLADGETAARAEDAALAAEAAALRRSSTKLFAELRDIYPIEAGARGEWAIRGLALPLDLAAADDESVAAALGSAAHLTILAAKYLQVSLRYQLVFSASRSLVLDALAGAAGTTYPLFRKDVERRRFDAGVRLLQADVEQLLSAAGRAYAPTGGILGNLRKLYD
ncbi:hypothetical protein M885DRAFT_479610 [Pelagophyceae sp. CCMP2097]|nr:hypothetical protein M885DRAFT_479610 [Pelagophyceae sp. CCMP2097]|mmetsp:Transcript_12140/g.41960  ORF Transcript_12140/g.41960 Transcript_12140/m.41960 type:complete len:208 (-) Transcript_12140:54-677(-)